MKFHKNVVSYMHVFCERTLDCANFCAKVTDRFLIIKKRITLTPSSYPWAKKSNVLPLQRGKKCMNKSADDTRKYKVG